MRHLQIEDLRRYGAVPFEGAALAIDFPDYADIRFRLSDFVKRGDVLRLKNGLFCLSERLIGHPIECGIVGNMLYGPSCVSFETALRRYGVTPERVFQTTSAVTKRSKKFDTPLGGFSYYQVAPEVASVGVRIEETASGNFLIANPTRALCDVLLRKRAMRVTSPKSLRSYLETDLRCDLEEIGEPDFEVLDAFLAYGKKPGLYSALRRIFI